MTPDSQEPITPTDFGLHIHQDPRPLQAFIQCPCCAEPILLAEAETEDSEVRYGNAVVDIPADLRGGAEALHRVRAEVAPILAAPVDPADPDVWASAYHRGQKDLARRLQKAMAAQ